MVVTPQFKNDLLGTIPSLRAFAVSLTQNSDKADDLVQETLVKAWDKHESFQMGTNLKAWLFTILRNEFYSQVRKRGREILSHPRDLGSLAREQQHDVHP